MVRNLPGLNAEVLCAHGRLLGNGPSRRRSNGLALRCFYCSPWPGQARVPPPPTPRDGLVFATDVIPTPDASADLDEIHDDAVGEFVDATTSDSTGGDSESTKADSPECDVLELAACRFDDYCPWIRYYCYNADSEFVGLYSNQSGYKPVPCSPAQMEQLVKAHGQPCWRQVSTTELPGVAEVLDKSLLSPTICSNIDGTRLVFEKGAVSHTIQGVFYCNVGGFSYDTTWELVVAPTTGSALDTKLPFLKCAKYEARSSAVSSVAPWLLSVSSSSDLTKVRFTQRKPVDWVEVVQELAASFVSCDKEGAAP